MKLSLGLTLTTAVALAGCGSSRTTYARFPGAPVAFDKAGSNPQAVEVADKVIAAAGGAAAWDKAKQIRWSTVTTAEGGKPPRQTEQAWDRWNARHWAKAELGDQGTAVAIHEIYGDYFAAYVESRNGIKTVLDGQERGMAIKEAQDAWLLDAHTMCMPFLLEEPGAKLDYVGVTKVGDVEHHDIKVTFSDADKARAGLIFHAIINKDTNVIRRIEIERPASGERVGMELDDWKTVNGLKFPGKRTNIGTSEVKTQKDISVGDPDDMLYIAPLKL
jgi:hypothetical protein